MGNKYLWKKKETEPQEKKIIAEMWNERKTAVSPMNKYSYSYLAKIEQQIIWGLHLKKRCRLH